MNSYLRVAVNVGICLVLILFPIRQLLAEPEKQMHRFQVSQKDGNGWYTARSTNGQFSVLLPVPFNDFSLPGDGASDVLRTESVGGESSEGIHFTAARIYYVGKGLEEQYFIDFIRGKASPGSQPQVIGNYHAIDFEVSNSTSGTLQRVVITNGSLIILSVEWPNEHESVAKALRKMLVEGPQRRHLLAWGRT
jgi:hypothetical protein